MQYDYCSEDSMPNQSTDKAGPKTTAAIPGSKVHIDHQCQDGTTIQVPMREISLAGKEERQSAMTPAAHLESIQEKAFPPSVAIGSMPEETWKMSSA